MYKIRFTDGNLQNTFYSLQDANGYLQISRFKKRFTDFKDTNGYLQNNIYRLQGTNGVLQIIFGR